MERIFGADVSVRLGRLERDLNQVLAAFVDPWVLIQFTLVIAALLAGVILGPFVERALEQRVRAVRGQPRLLRFLALVLRRTRWIVAALLLGAALVIMRAMTLPSTLR